MYQESTIENQNALHHSILLISLKPYACAYIITQIYTSIKLFWMPWLSTCWPRNPLQLLQNSYLALLSVTPAHCNFSNTTLRKLLIMLFLIATINEHVIYHTNYVLHQGLQGSSTFVTGYWKTDCNVTLGQLHFIVPANSHTHALSMHCCITGLS